MKVKPCVSRSVGVLWLQCVFVLLGRYFDTPWAYDKSSFLSLSSICDDKRKRTCPESNLRLLSKAKKGKTARWSVTGISLLYTIMARAAYLMKMSLFLRYISSTIAFHIHFNPSRRLQCTLGLSCNVAQQQHVCFEPSPRESGRCLVHLR